MMSRLARHEERSLGPIAMLSATYRGEVDLREVAEGRSLLAVAWYGRWRPLPALLHWLLEGTGTDDAYTWGARGSPSRMLVAGYVAGRTGEDDVARHRFRAAAEAAGHDPDADRTAEWLAWLESLDAHIRGL